MNDYRPATATPSATATQRPAPIVVTHEGIHVVRDDLYPGGTKARFLPALYADGTNEVVYASPAQGGAQVALAFVARQLGKHATIFVARRQLLHPRTQQVLSLGGKVVQIDDGYLTVVQAAARRYCNATGAKLAPFGVDMPEAIIAIAEDARRIPINPDEVWCAASSGTLARSLALAFPDAIRHCVQVGRAVTPAEVADAKIWPYPKPYDWTPKMNTAPFPADPHYELKAWDVCRKCHGPGAILFWNVVAPATAVS
jgi:hypothetical protein